ncbi:MAG: 2-amino-4-hydroxy-6-hydroxymethyldihydropteridine diphosphokinase [Acidobacteria bacterium]|nr:2-amino-4-hydroxy-6-hydroxymethyldihydropteridine diphosphokinase [Acidobacteriota bacterium]
MTPIYLALGSNLSDRELALRGGLRELANRGVSTRRVSSLYDTDPVGFLNQPTFLNMVAEVGWEGTPEELLARCLAAENALGRVREFRDGPRTLDIDVLLAGDLVLKSRGLEIPHPRMHLRRFVLRPLSEIAPHVIHPLMRLSVQELLEKCQDVAEVRRVGEPFTVEPPDPSGYNPAASRGKHG